MKMTAKDQVKSKGMWGGYALVALGFYLVFTGNVELGVSQIGLGFGILGIRDKQT